MVGQQTSMKPSTEPVTNIWPSAENRAVSAWLFLPNLIVLSIEVGNSSTSSRCPCACPLNKSNAVPGGRSPWCCCLRVSRDCCTVQEFRGLVSPWELEFLFWKSGTLYERYFVGSDPVHLAWYVYWTQVSALLCMSLEMLYPSRCNIILLDAVNEVLPRSYRAS